MVYVLIFFAYMYIVLMLEPCCFCYVYTWISHHVASASHISNDESFSFFDIQCCTICFAIGQTDTVVSYLVVFPKNALHAIQQRGFIAVKVLYREDVLVYLEPQFL